jgi:hypothetical protein
MAELKAKLWGKSSKELGPGERALAFHLAPVIIVAAGGLLVLVSMFMPAISSAEYATIAGNTVIQISPSLLLCAVAAAFAAVRYWRRGSSGSANLAIVAGFWFFLWAVIGSQNLSVTGPRYMMGDSGFALNLPSSAGAGVGMWAAGLGCLLVGYGGLVMRFPRLGFGLARRGFGARRQLRPRLLRRERGTQPGHGPYRYKK